MATFGAELSMSLDGFVADPGDGVDEVFAWYGAGDVETVMPDDRWTFRTSEASARHLRETIPRIGAVLSGRRTFDVANGWGGHHTLGVPTVVLTHAVPDGWPREDSTISFATDGLDAAVAAAARLAGDKLVGVCGPNVIQQCLNAGVIDELCVNLVPVLLGDGIRFFDRLASTPVKLEGPQVVEGDGVTHLRYRVQR